MFGRPTFAGFVFSTMAQRSRQLVAEVYSRLVSDKSALQTLLTASKPLRAYTHEVAALTSEPAQVLGATDEARKLTDQWLDEGEGLNGSLEVCSSHVRCI